MKPTLNLGCGGDDWGEVRVDSNYETQTGVESKLNVRADAHRLPFRDKVFSAGRCWHVLEHVENPQRVIDELKRTCETVSMRFPIDEGYYKHMLIGVIHVDWPMFIHAYRTMRRRAHRWIIRIPSSTVSDRFIEYPRWFSFGRKARYLKRFVRKYYFEMEASSQS